MGYSPPLAWLNVAGPLERTFDEVQLEVACSCFL